MFEQTPDTSWWVAGANLTRWFNWDAIAAIGTLVAAIAAVGAAIWAVMTWRESQRDVRRREAGIIRAVAEPIATVAKVLDRSINAVNAGDDLVRTFRSVTETRIFQLQAANLTSIRLTEIPSQIAVELHGAAVAAIEAAASYSLRLTSSDDAEVHKVLWNGLVEARRSLLAYAWMLEREARDLSAVSHHGIASVADIEALMLAGHQSRERKSPPARG